MHHRKTQTQTVAAARAGISERSARRIDHQQHQPQSPRKRHWRTRQDPLEPIWESIVLPLLRSSDELTPVGVFDHLCEHHTDQFDPRSRRTLERRICRWRQLHGPSREVVFRQTHEPGALGIADFTWVTEPVTIAGQALRHKLFHYRLVASGWAYAQVTYGGESFSALSDGLQKAFRASEGVPRQLRTDSLSAAYKNRQQQDDFTERFTAFCRHYRVQGTRNNRGLAHENGAIESPNNHIKQQLKQALLIRGSHDFASRQAYEDFVGEVLARRNRRIRTAFANEQRQLQPLPAHDSSTYSEHPLRVSRTSTILLKRVTYTVPSRLIGSRLIVRLFDDRLELWCAGEHTLTLSRIYSQGQQRQRSVNYHHVIESLVQKPRAFRYSQWRDELLPSDDYRRIWQHVDETLSADKACHYLVRLLHLAKKSHRQDSLGRYVLNAIENGTTPSLLQCEARFLPSTRSLPDITVQQHALGDYQALLQAGGRHE